MFFISAESNIFVSKGKYLCDATFSTREMKEEVEICNPKDLYFFYELTVQTYLRLRSLLELHLLH